jgi:hypothetical protein
MRFRSIDFLILVLVYINLIQITHKIIHFCFLAHILLFLLDELIYMFESIEFCAFLFSSLFVLYVCKNKLVCILLLKKKYKYVFLNVYSSFFSKEK